MRLFRVYFPARMLILAVLEALVVFSALLAAMAAFALENDTALVARAAGRIGVAGLVCMLCMYYFDLYDAAVLCSVREALTRLLQVLGTACIVLSAAFYVVPSLRLSPRPLLFWILLVGVGIAGIRKLFSLLNRCSFLAQRTVLLGDGPLSKPLKETIQSRPELGIRVVGNISPPDGVPAQSASDALEYLNDLVRNQRVDCIVLTMRDRRGNLPVEELLRLKATGVEVIEAATLFEAVSGKISLPELRPSWLLFSDGFCLSRSMRIYKRIASVALALPLMIVFLPLMLVIALLIRLDSPGPALFRQRRVGRGGRPFWLYKFRSMLHEADGNGGPRPASHGDTRVTRFGRLLRRLRLDELPQLYNILRGDMCFIGPRPFAVEMENELAAQIPFYRQRWNVMPGATGWAQVQRGYCETLDDNIDKLSYDLFYIKNLSVGLDLLILFQTIKILLLGRGGR